MSINLEVHLSGKTQSDYDACIDIRSVDPQKCFGLGRIFESLCINGFDIKTGNWGQGIFIRIPLVEDKDD